MNTELLTVLAANLPGIAAMIGGLVVLILLHELGHWLVAKWYGMKTPVFSIGFGKREWSLVLGTFWDTEFRLSPILLGGYVSIPELQDESTLTEAGIDTKGLRKFPPRQRIAVAAAGPIANVLVAFVIFAGLFAFIGKPAHEIVGTQVTGFSQTVTIAQDAGLEVGDKFVSIDGVEVTTPQDVIDNVLANKGNPVTVVVERDGQTHEYTLTPNQDGLLGVGLGGQVLEKYEPQPLGTAIVDGGKTTVTATWQMVRGIGMMVGLVEPPENLPDGATDVHGVVGIVQIGAKAFDQGVFAYMWIVAMISLNLAILNLLPIPMLDGGHIAFYTAEAVRGKPVSAATRERLSRIAIAFLFALMALGLFNDIFKPL